MSLNQALIKQINTETIGANGAAAAGGSGATGSTGPTVTIDVMGDGFFDPSATLSLLPEAVGGFGGAGGSGAGYPAFSTMPTTIESVGTSTTGPVTLDTVTWPAGTAGDPGGLGGTGALSLVTLEGDSIGSTASPYGGPVLIDLTAAGGYGGTGGYGGGGESAGSFGVQVKDGATIDDDGSAGGAAGLAGTGGLGGDGVASITSLSEVSTAGVTLYIDGLGGNGGYGGDSAVGGNGATGGANSPGGDGGTGGGGTADLADSTISDQEKIVADLGGEGAAGGKGGIGTDSGPYGIGFDSGDVGTGQPWTATDTYSASSNGGNGGTGGQALAEMTGNTLTAPAVLVTLDALPGFFGIGGAGGPAVPGSQEKDASGDITNIIGSPAGATGAFGQAGQGQIAMSDNTIDASNSLGLSFEIEKPSGDTEVGVTLDGAAGGNLVFSGNSLVGSGGATLDLGVIAGFVVDDLHGALSIGGSPANSMTGFSNFTLSSGGIFVAGDNHPEVVWVAPDADTIELTPGHAALTIDDASSTNTVLQFQGYGVALDSLMQLEKDSGTSDGNTTVDVPGDGAVTLTGTNWSPSASDAGFAVPCYVAGTRIATPNGLVPVEALSVGDRVVLAFGGTAAVVWLGHCSVDCRRHKRPWEVWPVRIRAGAFKGGAFGAGAPHRDLVLSPDHAVYVNGVLIPVRYLMNDSTIRQEATDRVTYYHVELPRHDVLLAEGLPTESYIDTGNRANFANGGGPVRLNEISSNFDLAAFPRVGYFPHREDPERGAREGDGFFRGLGWG